MGHGQAAITVERLRNEIPVGGRARGAGREHARRGEGGATAFQRPRPAVHRMRIGDVDPDELVARNTGVASSTGHRRGLVPGGPLVGASTAWQGLSSPRSAAAWGGRPSRLGRVPRRAPGPSARRRRRWPGLVAEPISNTCCPSRRGAQELLLVDPPTVEDPSVRRRRDRHAGPAAPTPSGGKERARRVVVGHGTKRCLAGPGARAVAKQCSPSRAPAPPSVAAGVSTARPDRRASECSTRRRRLIGVAHAGRSSRGSSSGPAARLCGAMEGRDRCSSRSRSCAGQDIAKPGARRGSDHGRPPSCLRPRRRVCVGLRDATCSASPRRASGPEPAANSQWPSHRGVAHGRGAARDPCLGEAVSAASCGSGETPAAPSEAHRIGSTGPRALLAPMGAGIRCCGRTIARPSGSRNRPGAGRGRSSRRGGAGSTWRPWPMPDGQRRTDRRHRRRRSRHRPARGLDRILQAAWRTHRRGDGHAVLKIARRLTCSTRYSTKRL